MDYTWNVWKLSMCFSRLLPAVSLQKKCFFFFLQIENKHLLKRTIMKRKWCAPQNDSDASNQFFLNLRKQSKYRKTHGGEIYGSLWTDGPVWWWGAINHCSQEALVSRPKKAGRPSAGGGVCDSKECDCAVRVGFGPRHSLRPCASLVVIYFQPTNRVDTTNK